MDEGIPFLQLNIRGILYADNVVIFTKNHTQLQQIMFNLESFCFTNDLAVNISKLKVMLCGPVKNRNRLQIEYTYIKERFWKM